MLIQLFSMYLLIISSMAVHPTPLQTLFHRAAQETAEKLFGSENPVGK